MNLVWWDPRQKFKSPDGHKELCKILQKRTRVNFDSVCFSVSYNFCTMSGKKRSATRAQFCATRAQFCATRAQFQKVSVSEIDSNTFRSFYGLDMLGVRTPNIFGGNHLTVHVESEKICIEQHFNSSILIVSPFMSDTRLASCQTLVSGADMLGQRTNGPQDVKPADIDELIRATKLKHKMMMHELKWLYTY